MTDTAVPFIRSGTGSTPAEGGCWMQMLDWTTNNGSWTDQPPCVHPVIRHFGIAVNDRLPDDERQVLMEPRFAYRAVNTNTGGDELTRKLLGYLARQVYPIYKEWKDKAGYDDEGSVLAGIDAAQKGRAAEAAWAAEAARAAEAAWAAWAAWAAEAAWAAGAAEAAWAAGAAEAAWAAGAAEAARAARAAEAAIPSYLDLLTGLLDEYDRITGRTETPTLDFAPVCRVLEEARA